MTELVVYSYVWVDFCNFLFFCRALYKNTYSFRTHVANRELLVTFANIGIIMEVQVVAVVMRE